MGTISDKLMRVINTKEDIRKALMSKGYDVPTSIPFKEYAKMILDLPCKIDGFPELPGDVTRWHFGGLTNEMMAAMDDPRIEDADHKGRFLSFKNFAWKGMSGVGGYGDENYQTFYKFTLDDYVFIASPPGVEYMNFTFRVTGLQPGNKLTLAFFGTTNTIYGTWDKDGIYTVNSAVVEVGKPVYFYNGYGATRGEFTIEILPLYPGFILGDGVDDFAVTEKELNFEDTYTVYTAFIPFQNNPTINMILCGADNKKTFTMQYPSLIYVSFIAGNNYYINAHFVNGLNLFACKRNGNNICIKNLLTNKVVTGTCGDWVENAGLYYLWKNAIYASFARAGIAGQIIDNGHFTTDEEDENILNWHKKQYPWLFPDQAWTVVGKTNEDEDRATIANITGNGNDLVLSNFGFAEGSGYGLYAYNFNSFSLRDNVVKPTDVKKDSFRMIGTGNSNNVLILLNESDSADWKIRITGMKEGDRCLIGNANKSGEYISVNKDGTYTFQKQYAATSTNGIWYNSSQEVDVLVEQIPEYEGYLVTDGVDDKAVSKQFKFGENFTVILDFKFPVKKISYCGFDLSSKVRIQNLQDSGVYVVLKGNKTLIPSNVVRAVTSEGKVYDENWNEYNIVPGNISSNYTMVNLGFDGSTQFAESATKLAGIYSSTLSKDDCIKAYNYLQTLKSK